MLVIDDSPVTLHLIRRMLIHSDFTNVKTTEVASKGLELLRARPFGLVICDYYMSPMNGWDLYRTMQRDPALARIPFVLTTAQEAELAVTANARNMLRALAIKPFTASVLLSRIARADATARAAA
ncbi:MAG: response regulator [Alsobacter sp.]